MLYVIFGLLIILFIGYLYYQTKIKNNKNYPITLAMILAFLVMVSNNSVEWIIKNINKFFGLDIETPKSLSTFEIAIFFILLYGLSSLYYKYSFGKVNIKSNFIFSIFHIGNNKQSN